MVDIHPPIVQAERRAWNYWSLDGLPSLVAGIGSLLIAAVLFYTRQYPRPYGPMAIGLLATATLLYIAITVRMKQIIEWLKARITYPRAGYVASPYFVEDQTLPVDFNALFLQGADAKRFDDMERVHRDRKLRILLMLALLGSALASTILIKNRWICVAAGAGIALALWLGARKDERLSWLVLGGFLFLGLYMSIFSTSVPIRAGYFLAGGGLLFVIDGATALVRFLRRNPLPRA